MVEKWWFLVLFLVFALLGVLTYFWNKEKMRKKEEELNQCKELLSNAEKKLAEKEAEKSRMRSEIKDELSVTFSKMEDRHLRRVRELEDERKKLLQEILELTEAVKKAEDYAHEVGMMAMGTNEQYTETLHQKELLEKELAELKALKT